MKKINLKNIKNRIKNIKRNVKRMLKYTSMSFIICYGSAIVLRLINAFLGINTPDFWWYFIPASFAGLGLTICMLMVNKEKIFKKYVQKKPATNTKKKVRKKSAPAVSTPEREYRRKVS